MNIKEITTEIQNVSFVFVVGDSITDLGKYLKKNYDEDLYNAVGSQLHTNHYSNLKNIVQLALGDNIYLVSKEDVADNTVSLYTALCHSVYNDPRFNKNLTFTEFFESGELMYLVENIMS